MQVAEPLTSTELDAVARMRRLLDLFPPGSKAKIIRQAAEDDGTIELTVKAKSDEQLRMSRKTGVT